MSAVARMGDLCTGHGCYSGRPSIEGSSNVTINGIPALLEGNAFEVHCCGPACHSSVVKKGSGSVKVNGKSLGRVGDPLDCGSVIAEGSNNVFAGG